MAAGSGHSLAVRSDGTVWAWGYNAFGQLGDGSTTDRTRIVLVERLNSVVDVAAGANHSLALRSDGTVWTWGLDSSGQYTLPMQVQGVSGVVAVATSGSHSLALRSDGTLWAWGYNPYGQLGDGTTSNRTVPVRVP